MLRIKTEELRLRKSNIFNIDAELAQGKSAGILRRLNSMHKYPFLSVLGEQITYEASDFKNLVTTPELNITIYKCLYCNLRGGRTPFLGPGYFAT
jgi:hypothetical protein